MTLGRFGAALAVLLTLLAGRARADSSAADALIQEGLRLRREGKPQEALERFRHAHELAPSSRTYGQMGLVEATLKRWTDAETHLSVALASPDDVWVRKNRAFLDQALALCREHVGDLVITGPAGAEVFVAGESVGTLPAVPALRIVEGTVEVTATAPGSEPFKRSVTVHAAKRTALNVTMAPQLVPGPPPPHDVPPPKAAGDVPENPPQPPPPQPPAPPPPPPPEPESHWHTWTGITLGVLGAGAAAFGISWVVYDGHCELYNATTMRCEQAADTKTVGWIATAGGAALLATGAVVFFTGPSKSEPAVALGATPRGLWLQARF
jgi:hypothetical protein